jgi:tRNA(His) 5'-end guanylyltransferase
MVNDRIGNRMKRYEMNARGTLMRRTPVIIRVDMKAGHTFCRHLDKPWDKIFKAAMEFTMRQLCQNIQGAIFGYTQSDEISILCQDWATLTTDAWFGYEIPKLCSITASMATLYFNQEFRRLTEEEIFLWKTSMVPQSIEYQEKVKKYHNVLKDCVARGAMFDARCFNLPFDEVTNYFYWREIDAVRNSIQMCGHYYFSVKELHKKNSQEIIDMLAEQKGFYWEHIPLCYQHGTCCYRGDNGWMIDNCMPILKGEDREYLEKLI